MKFVKNIAKKFIKNKKMLIFINLIYKKMRASKSIFKAGIFAFVGFFNKYIPSKKLTRGTQLKKMFIKQKIRVNKEGFIYTIDPYKMMYYDNKIIDNLTIDYNKIIKQSLNDYKIENEELKDCEYKDNQKNLLDGIEILIDRIVVKVKRSNRADKEKIKNHFERMKNEKVQSFEEALQRILFYNQLLWQTGHLLNGLGRIDKILNELYEKDIKEKIITEEKAKKLLLDFCKVLHENYWYKSSSLMGDTGQIIILGGTEEDGSYYSNRLTYMFIEVIKELQLPDPKVLLRVSDKTPRNLIELSIDCIKTGIGCPLFSNDDIVIPKLIEFGYDKEDAYNYVTSACWEPLIASKSIEPNNAKSIIYMKPFNNLLENENLDEIKNKRQLINIYKKYLEKYVNNLVKEANKLLWDEDPLLSLFTENCNNRLMDISKGGAKYNNFGFTSVSLANTINAIEVINKLVFEKKEYKLSELNNERKNNFKNEEILEKIRDISKFYGKDDNETISIVNEITESIEELLKNKTNSFGGKIKFGLSAPSYISDSENFEASLDGRRFGEAFSVHISSDNGSNAYTELIRFASQLDYTKGRFNGNVVDFMVTPDFIEKNYEKFVDFIMLSINSGFFQMQMNVISSDILIKAKNNPKEFPNLIVRVWGFSAYFNDLPENYKNLLIERALKSEGKSY